MLKRSFAEFHAQKAIGGHKWRIQSLEGALQKLKERPWPECPCDCSKQLLRQYCDALQRLHQLNRELMPMILQQSKIQKALVHGRVVLVVDQPSGLMRLGVVFMDQDAQSHKKRQSLPKGFTVLTLHAPGPWDQDPNPPQAASPSSKACQESLE